MKVRENDDHYATFPTAASSSASALAACVYVNHWLGRPSRSLVAYVA